MPSADYLRGRRSQRGQTILLIAISMVSLLAMAALAIDVVTLYVARTEVQRAADAAALAGAKAIADSGVTTLPPGDTNLPAAITLAESMATSAINAVVSASAPLNNRVAGSPPTEVGSPTFNNLATSNNNNPTVTVILQQTNLPTFFARIWGQSASTTSASATAEVYNPSNSVGGSFTGITPRCVKPWLVANLDPTNGGAHFIDPVTGAVVANLATLTATPFDIQADCPSGNPGCSPPANGSMQVQATPPIVQYLPMLVAPSTADTCPASGSGCAADLAVDYEEGVACCNAKTYSCGGTQPNADWDSTISPENGRATGAAALATECLIHASTTGATAGQDVLDYPSPWPSGPPQIIAGTANPMNGQNVTTSSSIVTIPIIDRTGFGNVTGPVTVLGFLQAFVNEVSDTPLHVGEINITVMNVVGCSSTPNGNTPIVGGNGASTIPVRLISTP
ncbi:exported hypothetical protein [Candidatus Sulfotelmatobacter sp. SbA7]|nr:exported hypothetical protein [Candidatus Sulfotelmatobacter sp. SbA7]